MKITIKDIAAKAGVGVSTVSRALNNRTDINQKTREKILKIMEEHGYNPNSVARGLVMKKFFTIGLIIPDISNPFFSEIALGIEKRAKEFGYTVVFVNTDNDVQSEKDAIRLLKSKMVDGIIVSLSDECMDELKTVKKLPIIQIDRKNAKVDFSGVFIDNRLSAYNATKYLLELGHRKIAHFTGNLKTQTAKDRLEGFKKAVYEYGLGNNDILIEEGRYNVDSGKEVMRKVLKSDNIPTAIFAASDLQAAGILYVASRAGIKVPQELSIMGHDDIDLSYLVSPNITTMEQPKKEIGALAVDLLLRKLDKESECQSEDIVLETKLVIRESTSKPCSFNNRKYCPAKISG